ncbi:hypothetical protein D9M68_923180 [compost metagenome]
MKMWASTWKNTAAKNQRTGGCRNTGHMSGWSSSWWAASLKSGSNQTLAVTAASVPSVQAGKWPIPKRSNHQPATTTVSRNPREPQSRTRP